MSLTRGGIWDRVRVCVVGVVEIEPQLQAHLGGGSLVCICERQTGASVPLVVVVGAGGIHLSTNLPRAQSPAVHSNVVHPAVVLDPQAIGTNTENRGGARRDGVCKHTDSAHGQRRVVKLVAVVSKELQSDAVQIQCQHVAGIDGGVKVMPPAVTGDRGSGQDARVVLIKRQATVQGATVGGAHGVGANSDVVGSDILDPAQLVDGVEHSAVVIANRENCHVAVHLLREEPTPDGIPTV
mmetsp:Transcript_32279/g.57773  ORF Transcript_32279/g.57773 Transcript_32279/m.57773 type:complete len:239 (-) Transcript_32279:3818-4534(-)